MIMDPDSTAPQTASNVRSGTGWHVCDARHVTVDALIEELAFKYLLHLPSEEYENEVQLCYAFQLAHWEYLDAPETEHLTQKLSFSQFVIAMLDHTPEIGLNKQGVPVCPCC